MADQLTTYEGAEFTEVAAAYPNLDDSQVVRLHELAEKHQAANPFDIDARTWARLAHQLHTERFPAPIPDRPPIDLTTPTSAQRVAPGTPPVGRQGASFLKIVTGSAIGVIVAIIVIPVVLLGLGIALLRSSGNNNDTTSEVAGVAITAADSEPTSPSTEAVSFEPVQIAGPGSGNTDTFEIPFGAPWRVEWSVDSDCYYSVDLHDPTDGGYVEDLFAFSDDVPGSGENFIYGVAAGTYYLSANTGPECGWALTIHPSSPPVATTAPPPTVRVGDEPDASALIPAAEDLWEATVEVDGEGIRRFLADECPGTAAELAAWVAEGMVTMRLFTDTRLEDWEVTFSDPQIDGARGTMTIEVATGDPALDALTEEDANADVWEWRDGRWVTTECSDYEDPSPGE